MTASMIHKYESSIKDLWLGYYNFGCNFNLHLHHLAISNPVSNHQKYHHKPYVCYFETILKNLTNVNVIINIGLFNKEKMK